MMDNKQLHNTLGFILIAFSALADLIIHLSGIYKEMSALIHFLVFVPFLLGVVVLMISYLKER
jgi:hypothetical protein